MKQRRFTMKPLPPDTYAELAVLRSTAEATTYDVMCAGVYLLSKLTPEALKAVVDAARKAKP